MNLPPLFEKFIHYSFEKNSNTSHHYIIIIIKMNFTLCDIILNVRSILYVVYAYSKYCMGQ